MRGLKARENWYTSSIHTMVIFGNTLKAYQNLLHKLKFENVIGRMYGLNGLIPERCWCGK